LRIVVVVVFVVDVVFMNYIHKAWYLACLLTQSVIVWSVNEQSYNFSAHAKTNEEFKATSVFCPAKVY